MTVPDFAAVPGRQMTPEKLAVGQRLRMRLRPLALAVGLLISFGLPITYYALEFESIQSDARGHAREIAAELPQRPFDMLVADFLPGRPITEIRVLDANGRALTGYTHVASPRAWWYVSPPTGRATTTSARGEPWTVEVTLSQARLLSVTVAVLLLSVTVGVALASIIYAYPVRIVEAVEQQIDEMLTRQQSLVEASRVLASTLDLREVLDRLSEIARGLPGIDVVRIWLVDEHRGDLVLHSQAGVRRVDVEQEVRLAPGRGLTSAVIESGRPVVVRDTATDPRLVNVQWIHEEGIASFLGVPLRMGDTLVGALACMSRTTRDWSPAEIALADTLGTLSAVAIRNARLFGETESRRRAAEALAEVGRVLAQSLDHEAVSHRLADAICSLLDTRTSAVYRLDPESDDLVALAVAGTAVSALPRGAVFPRGTGMSGLAVRERRPVMTPDILVDPRVVLTPEMRARVERAGYAAVLTVPLIVKDRVIGALGVGDRAGRIFNDEEVRLAQAFADQAALALENARLYAEATRRQREAEELARFARSLTETLDVTTIGDRIVGSVIPVLNVRSSILCVLERDRALRAIALGGVASRQFTVNQVLPAGGGVIGRAAELGLAVQSRDVLADPDISLPLVLKEAVEAGTGLAVLAVPLHAKSELIGVLAVADGGPRDFTDAETALLQTFADQAAIALDNARLYQRAQQAYDELATTQAQLVRGETLRAMGELASGVAHHLNNLLAVVLGRLQLARAKTPPPPLDRHLELAERAALDGAEVVRRMRGFSRGQPTADLEPVDLNHVAEEVIELTRPRWQDEAQVRGITIEARLEGGPIPPVAGEVAALREVLMNLIMNAIDALPAGGTITVRTSTVADGVQCEVSDTGVGMPDAVQRRALEPFFTTKGFQSTGLGLSVTYGIVRRHGGDLVIDSTAGEGTRVRFKLPATGTAAARRPISGDEPGVTSPLRILVVDDEQEVRNVVSEILAAQGHEVVQASGGPEGLAYLDRGGPVDLVLTDLGMPGMTGWEVARAAKARRPSLRVGLLTGWGEAPAAKPEDRAAADFVIAKPVTLDGLRAALASVRRD
jgi:GAF domain-containing protein/CheY-like chemotaxis protein